MSEKDDIIFIDIEASSSTHAVYDIGALREDESVLHEPGFRQHTDASASRLRDRLTDFAKGAHYLCGHNIVHHDLPFLADAVPFGMTAIDTLYMSPLLFPKRPYHKLLKDDKLRSEELNNPVNDCHKAQSLFYDEVAEWNKLPAAERQIMGRLLTGNPEFDGFLHYTGFRPDTVDLPDLIADTYRGHICAHSDIALMVRHYPVELAYALALVRTDDSQSITPPWVLYNFPKVENVMKFLRHTPCKEGCDYCREKLDVHQALKRMFGYDEFRTFDGEPLQERAVRAAVEGQSLLTVFPTGGGKSLTFQLPALMEAETVHGLTVVISPLQSLMKDQVDNLSERSITSAVTINGMLDPISRADSVQRVADGTACLLYISPEMLRSKTIEHLLGMRHVVRFVIDEAHCFSAWGQDFRVDYLYIGEFIARLQERKQYKHPIPVSCFTATAKQKVISDICDYFKKTLGVELQLFASSSSRKNLQYSVIHVDSDDEKYSRLRDLIGQCPNASIVYVARTRKTRELAERLTHDGMPALPFNGRMDPREKIANQTAFMNGEVLTIVATSAFGMGVDKKDVGMVVHYDISDSLENYVQEAGRAGRDPQMQARCYVLYGDQDLDKHFVLLNQTKLSMGEIQQVWKAVKELTRQRNRTCCSALEIARAAGWDDTMADVETRIRTAVAALEQAGYVKRGNNVPHVYATGIRVKNMDEAHERIVASPLFDKQEQQNAIRIIKSLISSRSIANAQEDAAESRVDYLADMLGMEKATVVSVVERMRQEGILADTRDMTAYLYEKDSEHRSSLILERYKNLEQFVLNLIPDEGLKITCRQLNDRAVNDGVTGTSVKNIRTLLNFLAVKGYVKKKGGGGETPMSIALSTGRGQTLQKFQHRILLSRFLVERMYGLASKQASPSSGQIPIQFSVVELLHQYQAEQKKLLFADNNTASSESAETTIADVEEALLYLSKIDALHLEGGFLVLYNAMEINRLKDNKIRYKTEDYRLLNEFYKQKIQQVHIVGEYANLMVRDYDAALQYVQDYFNMDYKKFVAKYFKGDRAEELQKNITPAKYRQLFGDLSERQREIINDKASRLIVVAAGPGSGKTRLLVHKMASLLMLEEVKHEQLLMLTFSRAAATEFKQRLIKLIGNAAHFVEIKTFHSYCFNLLGRIGSVELSANVVGQASDMINRGEVEPNRISKMVLVIDEAQDMDKDEYALVQALMRRNEEMRVIAVGDDDQNVYQFRGADSRYMRTLVDEMGAKLYEMTENYRSDRLIVELANRFVQGIKNRMKTTPIAAIRSEEGTVSITEHVDGNLEVPVVQHLLQTLMPQIGNGNSPLNEGSCGVLTNTNEEALCIATLLRHHRIPCRLIQGTDGFRFGDLAEVRHFIKAIEAANTLEDGRRSSPIVTDEVWQKAKASVYKKYARSHCLGMMKVFFAQFESVNRTKYISDLREFVNESSIEDFSPHGRTGEVVCSTIHKAKGREFDTVFIATDCQRGNPDDYLRQLYVGLTRAKRQLHIHWAANALNRETINLLNDLRINTLPHSHIDLHIQSDPYHYPLPEQITLRLTHRDVYLDYFKDKKRTILALQSGDPLQCIQGGLATMEGIPVVWYSQKMREELAQWREKGYKEVSAEVGYIVAWRGQQTEAHDNNTADKEKEDEYAVLLANITLERVNESFIR